MRHSFNLISIKNNLLQDRSGFFGNGSAFSDLYNVSSSGRSQENLQDTTRLRDNNDLDIKRTGMLNCRKS